MVTERPKELARLIDQQPVTVLAETDDVRAAYGGEHEHLVIMVADRAAIVTYVERLEREVERLRKLHEANL